jgi:4-hydroxybenzoate polyprenyltransferase
VAGFDLIYACQDADFDQQKRLHSIPARFGIRGALKIALVSHLLTIGMLFLLWNLAGLGIVFLVGISAISVLLLYQHFLVRPDDLQRVNIAFFNVNAIVSFGILIVGCIDLWFTNRI